MGLSHYPSIITMPKVAKPYPTLLEFLCKSFPSVPQDLWAQRISRGKVLDSNDFPLTIESAYTPGRLIKYFREVSREPEIPFTESILYHDEELLVSCKPPFLPVTPGGKYVNECLLNRLRLKTANDDLVPLHRIDRETAGIVLFSVNRKNRNLYAELFRRGCVKKTYQALSRSIPPPGETAWQVTNRIVQGDPWFRMHTVPGIANARSAIKLIGTCGDLTRFELEPLTGKTHQLRVHMSGLGFGIANDRLYPELQPETPDDFLHPLQLLAKMVSFLDPVTGTRREFVSPRELSLGVSP